MPNDAETPRAELTAGRFRTLDRRSIALWRGRLLLGTIGTALALLAAELMLDAAGVPLGGEPVTLLLPPLAVAVAGTLAAVFLPGARYRTWGYQLRERDVVIRRGVLWRSVSVVPHTRIQHVDTRRGPLERWLGLSRVVLFTAGTEGAVLTVPGLDAVEAEALRDHLAASGGTGDAV